MGCWTCKYLVVYYFDGRVYCDIYGETEEKENCPFYKRQKEK